MRSLHHGSSLLNIINHHGRSSFQRLANHGHGRVWWPCPSTGSVVLLLDPRQVGPPSRPAQLAPTIRPARVEGAFGQSGQAHPDATRNASRCRSTPASGDQRNRPSPSCRRPSSRAVRTRAGSASRNGRAGTPSPPAARLAGRRHPRRPSGPPGPGCAGRGRRQGDVLVDGGGELHARVPGPDGPVGDGHRQSRGPRGAPNPSPASARVPETIRYEPPSALATRSGKARRGDEPDGKVVPGGRSQGHRRPAGLSCAETRQRSRRTSVRQRAAYPSLPSGPPARHREVVAVLPGGSSLSSATTSAARAGHLGSRVQQGPAEPRVQPKAGQSNARSVARPVASTAPMAVSTPRAAAIAPPGGGSSSASPEASGSPQQAV